MPLKRSPPQRLSVQIQGSDTNISSGAASDIENEGPSHIVHRIRMRKRQHDDELTTFMADIKASMDAYKKQQDEKYNTLLNSLQEIKLQNSEIITTMSFISQQYDDMAKKMSKIETERKTFLERAQTLENKIDNLERLYKLSSIEIKNIPPKKSETKNELLQLVNGIGQVLDIKIQDTDVKDIYRIHTKKEENKPIIVDFVSALTKETIISKCKKYNRENKDKFNSSLMKLPGPSRPIYISENLTGGTRKLYFQAREYAKQYEYSFCWVTNGRIFLRKKEGAPYIRIDSAKDLEKTKEKGSN